MEARKNTMSWFGENCHQYHPHYSPKYQPLYHGSSDNVYGKNLTTFTYEASKRARNAPIQRSEFRI